VDLILVERRPLSGLGGVMIGSRRAARGATESGAT
jgi:hypothetical protein